MSFELTPDKKICDHCNGYGSSLKEDADRCTKCEGTGLVPKQFIVLVGRKHKNCFYTANPKGLSEIDKLKVTTGEIAYDLIGYADTGEEAQVLITLHTGKSPQERIEETLLKTCAKMGMSTEEAHRLAVLISQS